MDLLAVGGDLKSKRILNAYRHGIFPWFEDDQPAVIWWSPDQAHSSDEHSY